MLQYFVLILTEPVLLSAVRHVSGLQQRHPSPPFICSSVIQNGLPHENNTLKTFGQSPAFNSSLQTSNVSPLMERIGMPIPPVSLFEPLSKLKLPSVSKQLSFEMPPTKASLDNTNINQKIVEIKAPQQGKVVKQLAIRMIRIRHKKMKKHQLKKFRKKFRVKIMTVKKKRYILRETLFLSGLEEEMKFAESFNAEEYAAEKIRRAYKPLPPKEKLVVPLPWEFQPLFHNSKKKDGK